jgi:glycerol-3-phosphate O-acyltransferase/dihydroxyacetone phosphate acyltransferase
MSLASEGQVVAAGGGVRARRRTDGVLAGLARVVVGVFFRRVEVTGAARLPAAGPLLVVGNHHNGLIDPLLITLAVSRGSGRLPRFLATHLLWRNLALRPWVQMAGVIPIYRPKDMGAAADPAQNAAAFVRCHEELAAGGAVALFPEGRSHSEPGLVPLKTGAARIVLEAVRRFPDLVPWIVPIGLTFEAKGTFRSRALLEIGEPIDPSPEIALDRRLHAAAADAGGAGGGGSAAPEAASAAAVRALTARIEGGLKAVTLNYGSWDEARRIGRAAEVFAGGGAVPREEELADRSLLQRAFIEGYAELRRRYPDRVAAAAEAVDHYDRLLGALGLRHDQAAAAYPAAPVARWVGLTLWRLLLYLPLAVVGIVLNWLPYRLVGEIAARASGSDDVPASYKVFGGLVFFPLTWIAESAVAAWLDGPGDVVGPRWAAAAAILVAAPLTGWIALHFDDRRGRLRDEARAYLLLRSRRAIAAEVRTLRDAAAGEVAALVALYQGLPEP